ncbi:hypothetical protein ACFX12_006224 [Malus domestica]
MALSICHEYVFDFEHLSLLTVARRNVPGIPGRSPTISNGAPKCRGVIVGYVASQDFEPLSLCRLHHDHLLAVLELSFEIGEHGFQSRHSRFHGVPGSARHTTMKD